MLTPRITSSIPSVHSTGLQPTEADLVSSSADLRSAKSLHPTACFPRQAFPYFLCHALLPRRAASRCIGTFLSGIAALGDGRTVRKHSPCLQVSCGTSRTSLCKYLPPFSDCLR